MIDDSTAYDVSDNRELSGNGVPTSAFEHTDEIADRIKTVIDSVGGLARASEIAGVSNDALAKWRDGKARPAFYALATLARAAGRSADWVLLGDAPTPENTSSQAAPVSSHDGEFTLVPRLGIEASAGHGLVALAEEVTERLAFKTDWLREMGLSPAFVGLVTCRGDSQDPVIKDGALMLVDMRPDQIIRSGCFYVIVLEGDVLVKKINRKIDGTIELLSHNPAYPTEAIDSQRLDRLTIPGRVVWAGQTL